MDNGDSQPKPAHRPFFCGAGGYGAIFALDRVRAVKVCRENRNFCEDTFASEQEAYAVIGNRSPYFLPVLLQVPHEGIFLLRIYNDLRLTVTLQPYTFAQDRADRWMGQICGGLAFLEREGYAHNDLRPDNIAIDENGQIRLIDLGAAAKIGSRIACTEPFARQLTAEEREREGLQEYERYGLAGVRTETFALGSVWYAILRGHYPSADLYKDRGEKMAELEATYREKRFPALAVDSAIGDPEHPDTPEMANDRIVYKCWHNMYTSVAEMEQTFRDRKDGTEWYRFPMETDEWIAARRKECEEFVASGGLATLEHPWTKKNRERAKEREEKKKKAKEKGQNGKA